MNWKRQGSAILRKVQLNDGRSGVVVLIGKYGKEQHAVVVFQKEGGKREIVPVEKLLGFLTPEDLIDILCVQERVFGEHCIVPLEIK